MELKEKFLEYNKNNTPQQNWKQMETQIIKAIMKIYPYKEKTQQEKDTDWITKQTQWIQSNGRQTMEYLISKRRALQTRLEQLTKKNKTQIGKITLSKIMHTWKTHIQEHKQQILIKKSPHRIVQKINNQSRH